MLALLVGAVLASCGVVMQGLFRNALADPSLISVSSGASLGASLVIVVTAVVLSQSVHWSAYRWLPSVLLLAVL